LTFNAESSLDNRTSKFLKFFAMSHGTGVVNLCVYSVAVYSKIPLNISFVLGITTALFLNFTFAKRIICGSDKVKE
jgi:putative flippase GtrA